MESEYIALFELAKHVTWLKKLEFHDLDQPTLFVDNQSCIKTACNAIIQDRSKHIAVKYHYIRNLVEAGHVIVKYCSNSEMIADILTKPLQRQLLERFHDGLGLKIPVGDCNLLEGECWNQFYRLIPSMYEDSKTTVDSNLVTVESSWQADDEVVVSQNHQLISLFGL